MEIEEVDVKLDTNLKVSGNPVEFKAFDFVEPVDINQEKEAFTFIKDFIKNDVEDYDDKLYNITVHYGNSNYDYGFFAFDVSKGFSDFNNLKFMSPLDYYDEQRDLSLIFGFDIYLVEKPENKGGNDKYNMCLYKALKISLGDRFKHEAKSLKQLCGVKFGDKIPVDKIPIIENKYKINIIINGDYSYLGAQKYNQSTEIILKNGHYYKKKETNIERKFKCFPSGLPLVIWDKTNLEYYFKGDTLPIDRHIVMRNKNNLSLSNEELYSKTIKEYNELKIASNGKYDILKYRSIPEMAYSIFFEHFKAVKPDSISLNEALWLKNANNGGMRFAKIRKLKKGYSYDVNRFYPSLQCDTLNVPIEAPSFGIMEELPQILSIGIYRVKIKTDNPFFSHNKFNLYTQYSLRFARRIGAEIELIQDGKFNSMIYTGKKISTTRLKNIYNELYELSKKHKICKLIMNTIWGSVCERKKKIISTSFHKSIDLNPMDIITRHHNKFEVVKFDIEQYFKSNFARLGCFLTSKGRFNLFKTFEKYQDKIIYVHTDGFITNKKINIKLSDKMGCVRLDKTYYDLEIINKNKKTFNKEI